MPGHLVGHRRHVGDAGSIDPVVVELEQRADGDRVVQGFVRPACRTRAIDIVLTDRRRIRDHFPDERVERAIFFRDRRRVHIVQDALYEVSISQQLSRDRGV